MDKTDFALENYKNIQELIKFIDQKASILLVVYSLIISGFISVMSDFKIVNPFKYSSTKELVITLIMMVLSILLVVLLIYQLYLIIYRVLLPRKPKYYSTSKKSLYYFNHISEFTKKEFIISFNKLDNEKIMTTILEQIYEVSNILKQKEKAFFKATKVLFFSCILLVLNIFLTII